MKNITGVQAFVTAMGNNVKAFGGVTALSAPNNTKFEVKFWDYNGNQTLCAYSFIAYKTGNDAYREYAITIRKDTNGIKIAHGNFGISTAAVDSLRITILIPDTVIIGGGTYNTSGAAIITEGLPARTSIKITNYGKIVGIGSQGSSGESSFAAGSYQGACTLTGTVGINGGNAIASSVKIVVDNYGFIAGGGGGGGAGKSGAAASANGCGGGVGAGWPVLNATVGFGAVGVGGSSAVAVAQGGTCGFPNCKTSGGCCCGFQGPYGFNGLPGSYSGANLFNPGAGGNGINGGFNGMAGGALDSPGTSGANTLAASLAGKAVACVTGNVVNNLSGGITIGGID
ncbi:MAG: hypothetical protein ABIY51_15620 [Ferruginibacter sp.]